MVHNIALAPLAPKSVLLLRCVADCRAQQEIVDLARSKLTESLRRERLDLLDVGAVKLQDGNGVARAVVVDGVKGALRPGDVPRAEDDSVWLGLGEELADDLETLECISMEVVVEEVGGGPTRPEETPVATMVFCEPDIVPFVILGSVALRDSTLPIGSWLSSGC